jgi:hypothetical protein
VWVTAVAVICSSWITSHVLFHIFKFFSIWHIPSPPPPVPKVFDYSEPCVVMRDATVLIRAFTLPAQSVIPCGLQVTFHIPPFQWLLNLYHTVLCITNMRYGDILIKCYLLSHI